MNMHIGLEGRWRLRKYRRGGYQRGEEPLEVVEGKKNTLTFSHIRDLVIGDSADHMSSTSDLQVRDSGGSLLNTITAMESGSPNHGTSKQVVCEWLDDAGVSRTDVDELNIVTPGSVKISDVTGLAFGNKASNEDWLYEYTLTSSSADGNTTDSALDRFLRLVTGNSATHWDNSTTAQPSPTGGPALPAISCDAGFPSTPSTTKMRFEFTSADGSQNGDWDEMTTARSITIYDNTALSAGTKGAGDEWTYFLEITLS